MNPCEINFQYLPLTDILCTQWKTIQHVLFTQYGSEEVIAHIHLAGEEGRVIYTRVGLISKKHNLISTS